MTPRTLLLLLILLVMGACARQPGTSSQATQQVPLPVMHQTMQVHSIQAMITGIEQFDNGSVMGLNTAKGMYVVGPKVSGDDKQLIHEVLMDNHDRVVTIQYVDVPAQATNIAHKRVTAIVVEGREFVLEYQ